MIKWYDDGKYYVGNIKPSSGGGDNYGWQALEQDEIRFNDCAYIDNAETIDDSMFNFTDNGVSKGTETFESDMLQFSDSYGYKVYTSDNTIISELAVV